MVSVDKLEVRAILAVAVTQGIIMKKIMNNKEKTPYYFFQDTEVKPNGK